MKVAFLSPIKSPFYKAVSTRHSLITSLNFSPFRNTPNSRYMYEVLL